MSRIPRRALRRSALPIALGAALLPAPAAALAEKLPIDPAWAADASWDDGLAEVSLYAAERVIYGKPRPHDLRMIVVKEDFDAGRHVKADPPYEGRSLAAVLKLNLAASVPTENYPYQFLTSIFLRRDDLGRLVKATVGSQEWCGNTFIEIVTWGGPPRIHFHSYFDARADGEEAIALGRDGLLDEQLLVAIRSVVLPEGARVKLRVADPVTSNQAKPLQMHDADLAAAGVEDVATSFGRLPARRYDLKRGDGSATSYWVETAAPRALVRMESFDGRKMLLKERARRDYWSRR